MEEAVGRVDGSMAAEKGECDRGDVPGRETLDTGVSGMRECSNARMREWGV